MCVLTILTDKRNSYLVRNNTKISHRSYYTRMFYSIPYAVVNICQFLNDCSF